MTVSDKASGTALLLIDLQNDFIHADGAYARGGQSVPDIAVLPRLLSPLARAVQQSGGMVIVSQFTLVPGRGGEPIISPHLKKLRPFLRRGDFAPGSWGQSGFVFGLLHDPPRMVAAKMRDRLTHRRRYRHQWRRRVDGAGRPCARYSGDVADRRLRRVLATGSRGCGRGASARRRDVVNR